MRGDPEVLGQLVESMYDAVSQLEDAKNKNDLDDFRKLKAFILDIQERIDEELR